MSKLGDFLETVYGPSEGFETLRASIRHQRRRELAESARSGRPVFGKRKVPEDSPPRPDESLLSVWIELPGRLRIETEQQRGEQSRSTLTVLDGGHSWTRDDQGHVEEDQASGQKPGRGAAAATVTERHFSHARLRELFGALALEALGEVMYHPPRIPSTRPYLALMYRWDGREQSLWLQEAGTVDAELEKLEWETISRNGRELRLSDPDVEGGRRGVALEQAGTHVTIWSDIAREPLLDLASSLVPATG